MTKIKNEILSDTIVINSRDLMSKKNINSYIKYILKKKYEDTCNNNGYVIPDSLEIIERSVGKLKTINSESLVSYNINYKIDTIIPTIEEEFKCTINSVTKMGIIGYYDFKKNNKIDENPILFIIPNEYIKDQEKEYKKGEIIDVKVLDIRIKFRSKQIQIIGEQIIS